MPQVYAIYIPKIFKDCLIKKKSILKGLLGTIMALCVDGGLWKPGVGWSPGLSQSHNGSHLGLLTPISKYIFGINIFKFLTCGVRAIMGERATWELLKMYPVGTS